MSSTKMGNSGSRTFYSVKWTHTFDDEPILMVFELDDHRMETRKIEYFRNSVVGVADSQRSTNGTRLASEPCPSVSEINEDNQFEGIEISKEEFEAHWQVYV